MPDLTAIAPHTPSRKLRPLSLGATLIVAALCALAMIWLNESTHRRITAAMQSIQQVHSARTTINGLARALLEAESSQRGYIITGDREYLTPYNAALAETERLLKDLTAQAPAAMAESEAMTSFVSLLSQKIGEMALTVRMREEDRPEVVNFVVTSNVGLQQMRAFQAQGNALRALAESLVQAKRAETYRLLTVSRFGLAAGVLAAFLAFFLYVNQIRATRRADAQQQALLEAERDALESQVRERTSRLTELATHLQQAVEDERAHLARELHDEMGALLTSAKLDVARLRSKAGAQPELAERLTHLTQSLNDCIALKRRIIEDLRPSSLDNLGLQTALEILCREMAGRLAIPVLTSIAPLQLAPQAELTVYRFVQEALTNIGKYARARQVSVEVARSAQAVAVQVVDDGVGFDAAASLAGHHGLAGMRFRVESLGGQMVVQTAPGGGTTLRAELPAAALAPA